MSEATGKKVMMSVSTCESRKTPLGLKPPDKYEDLQAYCKDYFHFCNPVPSKGYFPGGLIKCRNPDCGSSKFLAIKDYSATGINIVCKSKKCVGYSWEGCGKSYSFDLLAARLDFDFQDALKLAKDYFLPIKVAKKLSEALENAKQLVTAPLESINLTACKDNHVTSVPDFNFDAVDLDAPITVTKKLDVERIKAKALKDVIALSSAKKNDSSAEAAPSNLDMTGLLESLGSFSFSSDPNARATKDSGVSITNDVPTALPLMVAPKEDAREEGARVENVVLPAAPLNESGVSSCINGESFNFMKPKLNLEDQTAQTAAPELSNAPSMSKGSYSAAEIENMKLELETQRAQIAALELSNRKLEEALAMKLNPGKSFRADLDAIRLAILKDLGLESTTPSVVQHPKDSYASIAKKSKPSLSDPKLDSKRIKLLSASVSRTQKKPADFKKVYIKIDARKIDQYMELCNVTRNNAVRALLADIYNISKEVTLFSLVGRSVVELYIPEILVDKVKDKIRQKTLEILPKSQRQNLLEEDIFLNFELGYKAEFGKSRLIYTLNTSKRLAFLMSIKKFKLLHERIIDGHSEEVRTATFSEYEMIMSREKRTKKKTQTQKSINENKEKMKCTSRLIKRVASYSTNKPPGYMKNGLYEYAVELEDVRKHTIYPALNHFKELRDSKKKKKGLNQSKLDTINEEDANFLSDEEEDTSVTFIAQPEGELVQ